MQINKFIPVICLPLLVILAIILLVIITSASAAGATGEASANESMRMVQFGISGSITTKDVFLENLTYGATYIVFGTSTGLYVFTKDGALEDYVQTSGPVTNLAVLDDLTGDGKKEIAISTGNAYFPNVMCYDTAKGERQWEFSPKTEVYDPYILWTMKQTSVFDMASADDLNGNGYRDLVLSSGYAVYALDGKTGERIWEFKDSDNVWDLLVVDDQNGDGRNDVLAGDQNGYLYLISGLSGEKIWSRLISENYVVKNPSTNSPVGSVKRSVWDIVPIELDGELKAAASAEDGYVYLVDARTGEIEWRQEVIDYVDVLLYNYYGDQPVPTGTADYNFFNLRLAKLNDTTGDGNEDIIASAFPGVRWGREYKGVQGLYLLDSRDGKIKWSKENIELGNVRQIENLKIIYRSLIPVPVGKTGTEEKIRLINSKDGSVFDTISINSTSGQSRFNTYFLKQTGKNGFVMLSNTGDLLMIDYPGEIVWNYPRINYVIVEKADFTGDASEDILVKSRDGADTENPFDEGKTRVMFVIDGNTKEVAWSYEVPFKTFLETGGLSEVRIAPDVNKDGKADVAAYLQYPKEWNWGDMYGEKTRLIVFDGKTGKTISSRPVTENVYCGIYDYMFKSNETLEQTIREGLLRQWGIDENSYKNLEPDQRAEFRRQAEERKRDILSRKEEFRIRKTIESLDIIQDQSGDGVKDFIVGSWNDVFIIDSVKGGIVWNRTIRPDLYRDPLTGEIPLNIYGNWTSQDRNRYLVVGDANDDGIDDLVMITHESIVFLRSNLTEKGLDYSKVSEMTQKRGINTEKVFTVGDINGDGVKDVVFEKNVQDAPPVYNIIDGSNGKTLLEAERSGTTIRLNAGDFNGNGFNDSIIFQIWTEGGGPNLEIVDMKAKETIWTYKGIEEAWMLRDIYGFSSVMPAAPAGDMNDDGIEDLAVARSLAWEPGAEVLVYDVKNNKILKTIVVEDIDATRGGDKRWMPGINTETLPDINGDGKKELGVIMATGEQYDKKIKLFLIDIANGEIINDFTSVGSEIINLGSANVAMMGSSGDLYFLDTGKDFSIISPESGNVKGSPVSVEWEREGEAVTTIFVDNKKTLMTADKKAEFEISSGSHKITAYSFDRYGKGMYDSVEVNVVKDTGSVSLAFIFAAVLLAVLFVPRIYSVTRRLKHRW